MLKNILNRDYSIKNLLTHMRPSDLRTGSRVWFYVVCATVFSKLALAPGGILRGSRTQMVKPVR